MTNNKESYKRIKPKAYEMLIKGFFLSKIKYFARLGLRGD
jgi:hypothetical protein